MGLKQDAVAFLGELIGSTMFLFLGLSGIKTAIISASPGDSVNGGLALGMSTLLYISFSMGFSLLITAWLFYRVTGGLFNPAVTLSLYLVGVVPAFRAIILIGAQIIGGIFGAGLAAVLLPYGGVDTTITVLNNDTNIGQGLFLEAFLTAVLIFSVLMLAAEKHKATHVAPIGIGLTLFVCQLVGTQWTGCGVNPARAFGSSVVSTSFPGYHWIYWIGPSLGSFIAVGFYAILKLGDYGTVVLGQDSEDPRQSPCIAIAERFGWPKGTEGAVVTDTGRRASDLDNAERGRGRHHAQRHAVTEKVPPLGATGTATPSSTTTRDDRSPLHPSVEPAPAI